MVEMMGFDSRWRLPVNPRWLQHHCWLSMSEGNNNNNKPDKSNRWNQAHCSRIIQDQGQNSKVKASSSPPKIIQDRSVLRYNQAHSRQDNFVQDWLFIQDIFQASQGYLTTLACWFKFNENSTSDSKLMYLSLKFERLILMSSHYGLGSFVLSLLKVIII